MGRKRQSFRERQDGAPLPLSQQLAAATADAPREADGSIDYVKAWTAPAAVDPVGEDLGDTQEEALVVKSVTRDGEQLIVDMTTGQVEDMPDATGTFAYAEMTHSNKALVWLLKNDLNHASRWATALANEPERLVYDLFSEAELEATGVDFAGDDFATASAWAVEQYDKWLESERASSESPGESDVAEDGSDDALDVESTTADGDSDAEQKAEYYAELRIKYSLPDHWVNATIDEWIADEGYNFDKTARGNWFVDPTRLTREVADFTTSELLDGIEGKLSLDLEAYEAEMANIYRKREPVEAAWSIRELIDFLKQGLEPVKTSTGAWKNDVTRSRRLAQDWTSQELQAWVKDEIRSGGETTDQKIAIEINKRFDLGIVSVTPADVRRVYQKMQSNAVKVVGEAKTADTPTNLQPEPAPVAEAETVIPQGLTAMNAAYLKTQTERYAKACAPGRPITAEVGAKEQRELDNLFRYILKIEDPTGFGNAMGYLRDFFKKNRDGLFDPQYAFRFTGSLRTDGNLQETHVNLLNIFQVYTDENKSARKQIDLPYMLSKFPTNRQAWLLEFFQIYC